jgi:hypothetical protein
MRGAGKEVEGVTAHGWGKEEGAGLDKNTCYLDRVPSLV